MKVGGDYGFEGIDNAETAFHFRHNASLLGRGWEGEHDRFDLPKIQPWAPYPVNHSLSPFPNWIRVEGGIYVSR